jgi:hypothetical protein
LPVLFSSLQRLPRDRFVTRDLPTLYTSVPVPTPVSVNVIVADLRLERSARFHGAPNHVPSATYRPPVQTSAPGCFSSAATTNIGWFSMSYTNIVAKMSPAFWMSWMPQPGSASGHQTSVTSVETLVARAAPAASDAARPSATASARSFIARRAAGSRARG